MAKKKGDIRPILGLLTSLALALLIATVAAWSVYVVLK